MNVALLRRHWAVVIVALLASVHVILPAVIGRITAGDAYQDVYTSDNTDWLFYVARTRAVVNGHSGANPYLLEHADDIYSNIPAIEAVLAGAVRLFRLDVISLQIALDAIMPFVITVLFYAVLYALSRSRWLSLAIPLFLIATNIWNFDKPVHIQLSFPLLLLFILGWLCVLKRLDERGSISSLKGIDRKTSRTIIGCGFLLGAIYFAYFIDWTFLYVLLFTAAIIAMFARRFDIARVSARILLVSAPFGIVYAWLISRAFQDPFYAESAVRLGVTSSHLPEMIPRTIVALTASGLFFLLLRSARMTKAAFPIGVFALLLANAIYPNHNVITGKSFQNAAHWAFMPVVILSLAVAAAYPYLKRRLVQAPRAARACALGLVAVFLFASLRLSSFLSSAVTDVKIDSVVAAQRYGPVLRYLQRSTPADSVVFTDDELSYLIPAFTDDRVYYLKFVSNLPGSDRELIERYLFARQFDPEFFNDPNLGIEYGHQILWENYFHPENLPYYRWLGLKLEPHYTYEEERHFAQGVLRELESDGGITFERMRKYRLDYIVWDKERYPRWTIDRIQGLEEVYSENGIVVYRAPPA
jgi:hypothetical protein